MINLIKSPATSLTAAKSFADLEFVPLQRQVSHRTGLEEILAALHRQRLVILTAMAITLLVAAILTLTAKPSYTAVASVQVDQWAPRVFADDNLEPRADEKDAERFLQTQVDRARSRTIAETVANKLQLAKSPVSLEALEVEADDQTAPRDAIRELQERVQVAIGLNTRVARISFTSGHPVVSARVANAFAESLIEANLQQKTQTSARAKQILLKQLAEAKQRLEGSERRMLAYARSADLTTTIVAPTGNDGKSRFAAGATTRPDDWIFGRGDSSTNRRAATVGSGTRNRSAVPPGSADQQGGPGSRLTKGAAPGRSAGRAATPY